MKKQLVGLLTVFSLLAVLTPVGASARPSSFQTVTVVDVYAITGWTDTGVTVSPGTSVTITASGEVNRGSGPVDPNGFSNTCGVCTSTTLPIYSLIGKIGAGEPFFVGTGPVMASGVGTLYLAFNDGYYGDNTGSFVASISADCKPGNGFGDKNHEHCGAPGQN